MVMVIISLANHAPNHSSQLLIWRSHSLRQPLTQVIVHRGKIVILHSQSFRGPTKQHLLAQHLLTQSLLTIQTSYWFSSQRLPNSPLVSQKVHYTHERRCQIWW
uniref:Uncharacterized protein n=1 Tax=Helianthus annuus TaxID=4232 RepID=A0A251T1Q1_HELAN